jgi:hypothetical protein
MEPIPVGDGVGEQRRTAIEVAALEKRPRLFRSEDPSEERRAGRTPRLATLHEARDRAPGTGSTPPRQFSLRGERPHLPEQRGVPEALDPDRLLGRKIELEDKLDEEDGVPNRSVSCLPHRLAGLPAHRLERTRTSLRGHPLERRAEIGWSMSQAT